MIHLLAQIDATAVTVTILAGVPATLAVIIGLSNRKKSDQMAEQIAAQVAGQITVLKDAVMREVAIKMTEITRHVDGIEQRLESFTRWVERHDLHHLVDDHDTRISMERRVQRLEKDESSA